VHLPGAIRALQTLDAFRASARLPLGLIILSRRGDGGGPGGDGGRVRPHGIRR
jgi:hypothetical protein